MQILHLDPEQIQVVDRLRAVDADYVALLAESIRQRGLDQPIRVTHADAAGFHRLISGAHRLSAVRLLGLESIAAIPFDGPALEAELMEVEENLVRRELSELDRAAFLAKHQALWQALYPSTKAGGDRRRAKAQDELLAAHPMAERFSAHIARKIGLSEPTVKRATRRYRELSIAMRSRIAGTWLADNGAALDALIGKKGQERPDAERWQLLDILLGEGGPRSVAEAERRLKRLPPPDPAEGIQERLVAAWGKAPIRVQEGFFRFLLGDAATRRLAERVMAEMDEAEARAEGALLRALRAPAAREDMGDEA
jgi:ParB family chromosome partitioning protein